MSCPKSLIPQDCSVNKLLFVCSKDQNLLKLKNKGFKVASKM